MLIASDGSPSAERAISLAECVAWPAGTELRIITVVAPVPVLVATALIADLDPMPVQTTRRSRSIGGSEVEVSVREGRPATRIVDEAREWHADLVIVGSRGQGALRAALLGSVAAEVVDHAPCAVLVARTVCAHSVLLAEDGSGTAATAAAFLVRVPSLGERDLRILSVAHVLAPLLSGVAPHLRELAREAHVEAVEAARAEHERIAATRAGAFARPSGAVSYDVRIGDPADEILKEAAERRTDLVVLGSHGRTGLQRVLLGSVARTVLVHADSSVLIVRPHQVRGADRGWASGHVLASTNEPNAHGGDLK